MMTVFLLLRIKTVLDISKVVNSEQGDGNINVKDK